MKLFEYIDKINSNGEKALSVFLTAGFPKKENFVELALDILNAGADMLEIGIPFSDPLADGPVIQHSSHIALENGIKVKDCINFAKEIKLKSEKPIIFMSYLNPLISYGINNFIEECVNVGVEGLIIPDLVPEEYANVLGGITKELDIILLSTPNTPIDRLKRIDVLSKGFIYFVSVNGTTGVRELRDEKVLLPIKTAYSEIKLNKMLVGFGISDEKSVKYFSPACDGVIVGSAVVSKLDKLNGKVEAIDLVKKLKLACLNN